MKYASFAVGAGWFAMLICSYFLWGMVDDALGMARYVVRILLVAPLVLALAIAGVHAFDRFTPNDWMAKVAEDETACAIVLAALILGVFWLCVQG